MYKYSVLQRAKLTTKVDATAHYLITFTLYVLTYINSNFHCHLKWPIVVTFSGNLVL